MFDSTLLDTPVAKTPGQRPTQTWNGRSGISVNQLAVLPVCCRACAENQSFRLTVTVWCHAYILQGLCTYPELHTHNDLIAYNSLLMLHWNTAFCSLFPEVSSLTMQPYYQASDAMHCSCLYWTSVGTRQDLCNIGCTDRNNASVSHLGRNVH